MDEADGCILTLVACHQPFNLTLLGVSKMRSRNLSRPFAIALVAATIGAASVIGIDPAQAAGPSCKGAPVDVLGTAGDDDFLFDAATVSAGVGDGLFVVDAQGGNDTIDFDADALVALGNATTCLSGGPGDDTIFGTDGRDVIKGNGGNDVLVGFGGRDKINGGAGADDLFGGKGRDGLSGGSGNDFLYGAEGNDRLRPGKGNDTTITGPGKNKVSNKSGTDLIIAEPYSLVVDGETLNFKGSSHKNVIKGGKHNDFIFGGSGNDKITDRKGSNWLIGRGGNDRLKGGRGIDTIFGGTGVDRISCGKGNDDWAGGGTTNYSPNSKTGETISVASPQASDKVSSSCEKVFGLSTTFTLVGSENTALFAGMTNGELTPDQVLARAGEPMRVPAAGIQPDSRG